MIGALLVATVLIDIGAIVQASPAQEISLAISILLLITIPLFYKLTITIDNKTLCASFGIGIVRKKVSIGEIAGCEPIQIRWWYGWGIHRTPYGWLYNVSGLDAVAIKLRSGRKLAFGTDDPQGLAAAIQRSKSAN
jgi:hypothetical protein